MSDEAALESAGRLAWAGGLCDPIVLSAFELSVWYDATAQPCPPVRAFWQTQRCDPQHAPKQIPTRRLLVVATLSNVSATRSSCAPLSCCRRVLLGAPVELMPAVAVASAGDHGGRPVRRQRAQRCLVVTVPWVSCGELFGQVPG